MAAPNHSTNPTFGESLCPHEGNHRPAESKWHVSTFQTESISEDFRGSIEGKMYISHEMSKVLWSNSGWFFSTCYYWPLHQLPLIHSEHCHIYLRGTITDDSNVLVRLTVRGDFRQYKKAQQWSWKPFSELIPRDIELLCYSCLWSLNISFFCSLNSFKTDACCHHRTGQSCEIIQPWLATIAEHNYLSLPFHLRVWCFLPIVMLSDRQ